MAATSGKELLSLSETPLSYEEMEKGFKDTHPVLSVKGQITQSTTVNLREAG